MVLRGGLGIVLFLSGLLVSSHDLSSKTVTANRESILANQFIVRFKSPISLASTGKDDTSAFISQLEELGIKADIRYKYSSPIFHGVSISIPSSSNASEIQKLSDVKSIHQVAIDQPISISTRNSTYDVRKAKILSSALRDNNATAYNIHTMTGVDKLHQKGIRGKGVKIGFVDSGIDYNHPALGDGCFGPGCKVVGGYDFVGDTYEADQPDEDPYDNCGQPGIWSAGVLFMEDHFKGVVGVAPDAEIYAYRLRNCFSQITDDIILAGLQRAYEDGVDIIHMIFHDKVSGGLEENPLAVATANLVKEGIFVSIGAGNVGKAGPFLPPDSTLGEGVAAVGSAEVNQLYASIAHGMVEGVTGKRQIAYTEGWGHGAVDWVGDPLEATRPVIEVTGSCTGEIPSNIPADLSEYAVLVKRECSFDVQDNILAVRKANLVLVYNTDESQTQNFVQRDFGLVLNYLSISNEDGVYLLEALKGGKETTISFGSRPGLGVPNKQSGGQLSDWTEWGPKYDLGLFPHFVAPGNAIFTTYPVNWGSYLMVGNTGLASAYTAGVAALYYSQKGGRAALGKDGPKKLRDLMIVTANPIHWDDGSGPNFWMPEKRSKVQTKNELLDNAKRAVHEVAGRATCNHDNCLRAMLGASSIAAPFCATYTSATASQTLPVWASACSGDVASRISSGCACLNTATATVTTKPTPTSTSLKCNHDNCLRAMLRSSIAAAPFCSEYTTVTTSTELPAWATACPGNVESRLSSGCSCLNGPTTTQSSSMSTSHPITSSSTSILSSTTSSSSVPIPEPTSLKAPVAQQGGGLINALSILEYETTITPNSLILGDSVEFKGTVKFEIHNPSSKSVTYNLSHDPSTTFLALDTLWPYQMASPPQAGVIPGVDASAKARFKESTVVVAAGSTKTVEVSFTMPISPNYMFPIYSGYIKIEGSNAETLSIPYQGSTSNMKKDVPIWSDDLMPDFPYVAEYRGLFEPMGPPVMEGSDYFTFELTQDTYPVIVGFNTFSTQEQRIDLVTGNWTNSDWKYPPVPGKNHFVESIMSSEGTIFPITKVRRSFGDVWAYFWYGVLADSSFIIEGDYRLVLSVLRPNGDRSKKEDWQIVPTAVFGVIDRT